MLRTATGTAPRILVVDPHPKVGALVERYVLMSGALTVRRVGSPLAALHSIQDRRSAIDCIVAAHDMAPISGLDFLLWLRSGRYGAGPSIRLLPFVLVLTRENSSVVAAAVDTGSATVTTLPFDRDALAAAVQRAMIPAALPVTEGAAAVSDREWSQCYHPDGVPETFGRIDHTHAPGSASNRAYIARTANDEATFPSLAQAEQWLRAQLKSGRRLVKG